jgi:AcrR family transcriptional regulator
VNTPAKHLPADERRAVTVEAVIALAGSQNPSEISTSSIAKYMNLTQGALFRHFPSKDAIWEAVMAWVAERLMSKMEAAAAGSPTHLAALEAMFMSHVDFVIEYPGVPRMMFGEMQRAEPTAAKRMAQALVQRYGEMLTQRIKQGQDEGQIAADMNVQAAATLFIGSIQGLVMQSMLSGDIGKIRQAAPGVFAIYLRGISCVASIASLKGAR